MPTTMLNGETYEQAKTRRFAEEAAEINAGLRYSQNLAAAAESVERNAKLAGLQDYYRAQSYKELAQHYAKLADEKAAALTEAQRTAGSIEQALATLELAGADQLSEAGVAYLADILLKFLADRQTPCALAESGATTLHVVRSLINHLTEAHCRCYPPMDFDSAMALAAYGNEMRAA